MNKKWPWLIIGITGGLLVAGVLVILSTENRINKLENEIDQFKASVAPQRVAVPIEEKGISQETDEGEEQAKEEDIPGESLQLSRQKIIELEGTSDTRTKTFILENEGTAAGYNFYIILDKLPSEGPSYKLFLYKVGEKNPVKIYQDETDLDLLLERGWEPPGVVGGIQGSYIEGPGEFYFEIEVKNAHWSLEVRKGPTAAFTG